MNLKNYRWLYVAAMRADDRFRDLLTKYFGNRAGDIQYSMNTDNWPEDLKEAKQTKLDADKKWMDAFNSVEEFSQIKRK